jgi:glycerate 2-kinase
MSGPSVRAACPSATRGSAAELALAIYQDAINAIRADRLMRSSLSLKGDRLTINGRTIELSQFDRILVVGAGKASALMAAALDKAMGDALTAGVVVTKYDHSLPCRRIRILEAGHPIPDENSVEAGKAIHDLAASASERDLVICLLSGGASALMELPISGISLEDLQITTSLLSRAGANINELNLVRACLSCLKAGGLARAAAPARVICLVISDVLGNPLNVIGSGPCFETNVDHEKSTQMIQKFGLWAALPFAVQQALLRPQDGPSPSPPLVDHLILGDIHPALDAARQSAIRRGLTPLVLTASMEGEAKEAGMVYGQIARDIPQSYAVTGFDCILAGGETTVTVRGDGKGGRSQELACAATLVMADTDGIALLAAGTDGTDGPTDAAGALVDGSTLSRVRSEGPGIDAALANNDVYPLLAELGCLVKTGPTQSNVGDLVIIVKQA